MNNRRLMDPRGHDPGGDIGAIEAALRVLLKDMTEKECGVWVVCRSADELNQRLL